MEYYSGWAYERVGRRSLNMFKTRKKSLRGMLFLLVPAPWAHTIILVCVNKSENNSVLSLVIKFINTVLPS